MPGHADGGLTAVDAGSQSDALGMISGRGGNDTFVPFFRSKRGHFIVRAAQFERSRPLQIFQFQIDIAACQITDRISKG
jgi:hypothetical protein